MIKRQSDLATIAAVAQMLAIVLIVAALSFARDIFMPLALGLLLSFLLSPIVNRLQRNGISNVVAVVATATLAFIFLGGAFTLLGRELTGLVGELPKYKGELVAKARSISGLTTGVGGSLDELADEVSNAMEDGAEDVNEPAQPRSMWQNWTASVLPEAGSAKKDLPHDGTTAKSPLFVKQVDSDLPLLSWATTVGNVLGPLATAGLVSVFALFMLIHREDLRDRIIAVVSHGNYVTTTEALDEAAERISRYLVAQTIVNTSYGVVLAIGLAIIGSLMSESGVFPNAILWGVLATCLRYVPYIGPIVSALFPLTVALSMFPGYGVFIAVLVLIVAMELLSNNVLEPWLYGASTGISAVAVIVAAVFWGWLWGPVGLLLSTPLTVCMVVLGRYVPRFRIFSTLLGEEVEIKQSMRLYQRLLAGDKRRAAEMLQASFEDDGIDTMGDKLLVPVLKRIRADHHAEHLSDADEQGLFQLLDELVARLGTKERIQADATADSANEPVVIGCAAHHVSESLVLELLKLSTERTIELENLSSDMLPNEVGREIARLAPALVVIVVLPKGGFAQARFLCKSIRGAGYAGPVLMSCLGKFKNFDKLFVSFRKAGATNLATSYSQTRSKIKSLLGRNGQTGAEPVSLGNSAIPSPLADTTR